VSVHPTEARGESLAGTRGCREEILRVCWHSPARGPSPQQRRDCAPGGAPEDRHPWKGTEAMQGPGHGAGQRRGASGERGQHPPEPTPAPALGARSGTALPGAARAVEEGAGQQQSLQRCHPLRGKSPSLAGQLRAAGSPDGATSVSRPPRPLSRSLIPSLALSRLLLHQPSRSEASSPLLKAQREETALQPPRLPCQGVSEGQGRDAITAAKSTRTLETGAIPPSHSC